MAKVDRAGIARALRKPDARFILLHGADEAGSRSLAQTVGDVLGDGVERVDLAPSALRQDPALLADEAASRSLFGAPRYIRVEGAGDECLAAVQALMETPAGGNPVVLVAGALRRESKLLKLALAEPSAVAFASYVPEGAQADRMIASLAREAGLTLTAEQAQVIAACSAGDRGVAAREIAKLAIFADVAPDRPGALPDDALTLLADDGQEGDRWRLVNIAIEGDGAALASELALLAANGVDGIAVLRPALQGMLQLAAMRSSIDSGRGAAGASTGPGKPLMPSERERLGRQASRWRGFRISAAIARLAEAERVIKSPGASDVPHAGQALFALARTAARER